MFLFLFFSFKGTIAVQIFNLNNQPMIVESINITEKSIGWWLGQGCC